MIVGGVLFGYFAGLTYWFPKIWGFKLNEKLGLYAFWCWIVGFLVAFVPLYILGLMGATRRLDHYDASSGWQSLFIVAGIGVCIVVLGVFFQILQMIVSIRQRKENIDTTGDPWNGRTLEWSTASPAPFYNFATIPTVYGHDAFWAMKHSTAGRHAIQYEDIYLPKNTPMGMYIAAFSFLFGFAIIWHVLWLIPIGALGTLTCVILRSFDENQEYRVSAEEIRSIEAKRLCVQSQ